MEICNVLPAPRITMSIIQTLTLRDFETIDVVSPPTVVLQPSEVTENYIHCNHAARQISLETPIVKSVHPVDIGFRASITPMIEVVRSASMSKRMTSGQHKPVDTKIYDYAMSQTDDLQPWLRPSDIGEHHSDPPEQTNVNGLDDQPNESGTWDESPYNQSGGRPMFDEHHSDPPIQMYTGHEQPVFCHDRLDEHHSDPPIQMCSTGDELTHSYHVRLDEHHSDPPMQICTGNEPPYCYHAGLDDHYSNPPEQISCWAEAYPPLTDGYYDEWNIIEHENDLNYYHYHKEDNPSSIGHTDNNNGDWLCNSNKHTCNALIPYLLGNRCSSVQRR